MCSQNSVFWKREIVCVRERDMVCVKERERDGVCKRERVCVAF